MGLGKRILVLEDEALVRRVLVRLLESFGHSATGVGCAADARAAFQRANAGGGALAADASLVDGVAPTSVDPTAPLSRPYELLIADVSLQGEDGRVVAAQLRRVNPELRVLLISGGGCRAAAVLSATVTYLPKPFTGQQLYRSIASLFAECVNSNAPELAEYAAAGCSEVSP